MKINFDRLSRLAGLPANGNKKGLYEGASHEKYETMDETEAEEKEKSVEEMTAAYEGEDDADEMMMEVDEAMLVQELRRAKRIMQENKRRSVMSESRRRQRKQNLFEAQLKQLIDEEVENVFNEMNLNSQWLYGQKKPTRSRQGYTHQGSFMPGFGFKR